MEQFTSTQKKDLKVLLNFVGVFCRARHNDQPRVAVATDGIVSGDMLLCANCAGLMAYALDRRRKCPLDPKPSCKNCHIHCYSKEYRARIREIMAFSGRRMIMRGRLDYLWHYIF